MKKLLLLVFMSAFGAGCSDKTPVGPEIKLLFLGNSYSAENDLPKILVDLAKSGRRVISTDIFAPGGWTLAQHANSADALGRITGKKWDYVILQDQSVFPAIVQNRSEEMYPAVRFLDNKIKQTGARPLLYMTWGRQNGMPEEGLGDFNAMQEQVIFGYMGIANELGIEVVPVGAAWKSVRETDPALGLWKGDGSHPSLEGSYLAACVFYAVLYQQSPEGLKFRAELPKKTAAFLQAVAAKTVLTDKAHWNIR